MRRNSARAVQVLALALVVISVAAAIVWLRMPPTATCRRQLGTTAAFLLVVGVVVFAITSLGVWWSNRTAETRVRPWVAGVVGAGFAMDLFGALFVLAAATSPNSCG